MVTNTGLRYRIKLVVSHLVSCDGRKVYSRLDFGTRTGLKPSTLQFDINGCVLVAPGT